MGCLKPFIEVAADTAGDVQMPLTRVMPRPGSRDRPGRHRQFKHPDRTGRNTVPHPNRDIKRRTIASIYRQAGWTRRRD